MDNVVEMALQSSHGGARVWAFGASGETNIIDVDTFTSPAQQVTDVPCKSLSVDADGDIESAQFVPRPDSSLSPHLAKCEVGNDFKGQHSMTARHSPSISSILAERDIIQPAATNVTTPSSSRRRPSYAACIVGFNIPELGAREGRWVDSQA